MSKRPAPIPSPLPPGLGRGGKRRKTDPPLPQTAGGMSAGLPSVPPSARYGAGGLPAKAPGSAPAGQQSNPEVQQRNQVAMQMLKMILPSPGPYAQLPTSDVPKLHKQLLMDLEAQETQPVHHAMNVLNLAAFEWRSTEALQLEQYPGLAKLLVDLALAGLSSSSPSCSTDVPPSLSSNPRQLIKSKEREWQEEGSWWWMDDEDLFVDQQALSDRLTWTTAVCNVIRNLSFHEHNVAQLLDASATSLVAKILITQDKDSCPLHNELAAIMLDVLQNLSTQLKLTVAPASLSLPTSTTTTQPTPAPPQPDPTHMDATITPMSSLITPSTINASPHHTKQPIQPDPTSELSQQLTQQLSRILVDPESPLRLQTLTLRALHALCQHNPQHIVHLLLLGESLTLWAVEELLGCTADMAREAAEREADGEMNYLDLVKVDDLSHLDSELLALHLQADAVDAATQLISSLLAAARQHPSTTRQTETQPAGLNHTTQGHPPTAPSTRQQTPVQPPSHSYPTQGDVVSALGKQDTSMLQSPPDSNAHGSVAVSTTEAETGKEREGRGEEGVGRLRQDRPPVQVLVGDALLVKKLVDISRKRAPSMSARHGTYLSKLQDRTKHPLLYAGTHLADRAATSATSILRTLAEDANVRQCLKPYELDLAMEAMSNGPFAEAYSAILTLL